jgi:hypothetical protein
MGVIEIQYRILVMAPYRKPPLRGLRRKLEHNNSMDLVNGK